MEDIKKVIQDKIKGCKETINVFKYEQSKYRDVFNTFDKFEAKNYEYYRARILALQDEIADLEDILKEMDFWEDADANIKELEEAEEDLRENKECAKYGL